MKRIKIKQFIKILFIFIFLITCFIYYDNVELENHHVQAVSDLCTSTSMCIATLRSTVVGDLFSAVIWMVLILVLICSLCSLFSR